MPTAPRHPLLLVVIDGWGVAPAGPANAITLSGAPNLARLMKEHASTTLEASGQAVGLPDGQMGNSEVGHLTIGAGRVVDQDFVRITKVARSNALGSIPAIADLLRTCRREGVALHLIGLLGPGGVHSHEEHLFALLEACRDAPRVLVHHVLDGRDTPPQSARDFARLAQERIDAVGNARVATVAGRYWTMDRDKRWERTQRGYRCMVAREGEKARTADDAIQAGYARGETDEFVAPTVIGDADPIRPGDAILVYNFRPDRVRQIVRALVDPAFRDFATKPLKPRLVSMTQYDKTFEKLGVRVAFPPQHPETTLGEHYSTLGLHQLRVAETEKYAHVTYFFSGGREDPFPGEERLLIPSPKVATYDTAPAMSGREITNALIERMAKGGLDLAVLNFAAPDMVGHTGKLEPTIEACRVVDECIGRLAAEAQARGWVFAVTADHGNAESMVDDQGRPRTAHTTYPVPFVVALPSGKAGALRAGGGLSNVAPTLLQAVGIAAPPAMTAKPLWTTAAFI